MCICAKYADGWYVYTGMRYVYTGMIWVTGLVPVSAHLAGAGERSVRFVSVELSSVSAVGGGGVLIRQSGKQSYHVPKLKLSTPLPHYGQL